MNGNVFYRGTTYGISPLDAAIFADLGLTTNFADVALASNLQTCRLRRKFLSPARLVFSVQR
jgi:hypothetical protein